MSKKVLYLSFILLFAQIATIEFFGQNKKAQKPITMGYKIEQGDTIFIDKINPAYIYYIPKDWKKHKNWREQFRVIYNFNKVYPYALKAKAIIKDADSTLAHSNFTPMQKEKYLKEYQKRLFREFEEPLKKLTITQGKLLLRLLDREIGISSYYIIKNYRGGITAGFWQGIAKLFGSDLKKQYDRFGQDKDIEELRKMWHNGSFHYLYYSIYGTQSSWYSNR